MSTSVTVTGVTSSVSVTETVVEVAVQVSGLQGPIGPKGDTGDVTPEAEQLLLDAQAAAGTAVGAAGTATTQAGLASGYASSASASTGAALASANDAAASAASAGTAASSVENLQVGTTTTGAPGTDATVVDVGTVGHPVLAFEIPRGSPGQDGSDGVPVEMRNSGTAIEWRYAGDLTWTQLVTIAAITGQDGIDGREVELQKTATHIQWRYTGGAWVDLIALADITGPKGDKGDTGAAGAVTGQRLWFDNTISDLLLPSITATTISFVNSNPDTIVRSSGSWLADGLLAGMKVTVSGAANAGNNGVFVITQAAADTLTLATIHALTAEATGAAVTVKADRERITRAPASGTEQDESQAIVVSDGDVTIDSYCTALGVPGALSIPAGLWEFHGWFWVSAGTTTQVKFRVLKVSASGVETVLFTTAATTITATSSGAAQELQVQYAQAADIALLTTDRIIVRIVGTNSSATSRTLHFVYQGSARASHIDSPITLTGAGVPLGGRKGQNLVKLSNADLDTGWVTPAGDRMYLNQYFV